MTTTDQRTDLTDLANYDGQQIAAVLRTISDVRNRADLIERWLTACHQAVTARYYQDSPETPADRDFRHGFRFELLRGLALHLSGEPLPRAVAEVVDPLLVEATEDHWDGGILMTTSPDIDQTLADLHGFGRHAELICEAGDVEELARELVTFTELRRQITDACRLIEERLIEVMGPEKLLELPGLPVMERRTGAVRKSWQSEDLFDRISREWSIDDVREALPLTGSLGWRVNKLRALGLDPDEWCESQPGRQSIQIHGSTDR